MPTLTPTTIVLIGMMGCGKSTVGRALAERTGWRYLDNDELVRAFTGRAAEEIDATDGEAALHRAEADALRYALTMPPPLILSVAAWVAADPGSQALLRAAPAVVYLRARTETLRARIGKGAGRRQDATDMDWLRTRHAQRDAGYRRVATLTIDTDELAADAIAQHILEALGYQAMVEPR
ncbi:MAG: shikimate kinase [Candidatus Limnocylindrales bacterium]